MDQINKEFVDFFLHCQKSGHLNDKELREILKPLKTHLLKQQLKKTLKFLFLIGAICYGIYSSDTLNWYSCAVSRICMIKLLPLYDWTWLEETKCLIPKAQAKLASSASFSDVDWRDCRGCENFDSIDVLEQTSFYFIRDKFLVRGLPVIVHDSYVLPNRTESLTQFIENISSNMSKMVHSEPCSFQTNLMMSNFATLDETFNILSKLVESADEILTWFISFRNCKFEALKTSRLMIPKPYFYPRTLQPPDSSWLLMSQNYENFHNDLTLQGLIIVTQIRGSLRITLKAKEVCWDFCQDLGLDLYAGESLLFLSNLWTFSYQFIVEKDFSVTFITETSSDFQ